MLMVVTHIDYCLYSDDRFSIILYNFDSVGGKIFDINLNLLSVLIFYFNHLLC